MKVIGKYKGKEKVYISVESLVFLISIKEPLLFSIYTKVVNNPKIDFTKDNPLEYIEFSKPDEIEYFKGLSFILDYNEWIDTKVDVLKRIIDEKQIILNKRLENYSAFTNEEHNNVCKLAREVHLYRLIHNEKAYNEKVFLPPNYDDLTLEEEANKVISLGRLNQII